MNFRRPFGVWIGVLGLAAVTAKADGLQGQLDYQQQKLAMNQPSILHATLTNNSTSTLYLSGIRLDLSHNVSGGLYKENILLQQLRTLGPQQSWDGPIVTLTPSHRGPLLVQGSIVIQGGLTLTSTGTLTQIPVILPIDDANRDNDGHFLRGTEATCDRPAGTCCDAEEAACFQKGGHCVYVAEGFNTQRVCSDRFSGAIYDHVTTVQVSSDGAHELYLASDHCTTDPHGVTCQARVVTDGRPSDDYDAVNGPCQSPDGAHVAYQVGTHCLRPLAAAAQGPATCRSSAVFIDGAAAPALPSWCQIPLSAVAFTTPARHAH